MKNLETIFWTLNILVLIGGFVVIGMTFYLGRNRIKEIDQLVLGYEVSSDSIFHKGLRLMNYSGAFAWRFGAKRSRLLYIRDQFDKNFQRPFIIYFWLVVTGTSTLIVSVILDKFVLRVT